MRRSLGAIAAVPSVDASSTTITSTGSPSARDAWSIARNVRPRSRSSLYAGTMKEIDVIEDYRGRH